jgi:hypothetical protein
VVNETIGETIVIDIFSALLGIASLYVMFRAIGKITLSQPKIWDEAEDWILEESEELSGFNEIRKQNPHIWME